MNNLCILTVLRSSKNNLFDYKYVRRAYNTLKVNISYDFQFCCLTDMLDNVPDYVTPIPLKYDWPGWWSKIELFRPHLFEPGTPLLYFDLDEMVLGNIDEMVELAMSEQFEFMTLRGFNPRALLRGDIPASGIMAWKAECDWANKIFNEFTKNPKKAMARPFDISGQQGDQGFIGDVLGWKEIPKFQDYLSPRFTCGKRSMNKRTDIFPKVKIASWSGNPRLHLSDIPWVKKWWEMYG